MARNKKTVIVDTSVVAKWFVDEEHTEQALALRDSYSNGKIDIACPSLIPYEILNALRYSPEFGQEKLTLP